MPLSAELREFIAARYAQLIARCREANVALYDDAGVAEHMQRVLLASDFAFESFRREPALLGPELVALMSDPLPADARRPPWPHDLDETGAMSTLRKFRLREALRLIWRDVNRIDSVEQTLAGASVLAETCLDLALAHAQRSLIARHGEPRDEAGKAQRLVVLAFGKPGGGELNFSSDIDLILAFAENGQTDGARSLANEAFFASASNWSLLPRSPSTVTCSASTFARPPGRAGRIAMSFSDGAAIPALAAIGNAMPDHGAAGRRRHAAAGNRLIECCAAGFTGAGLDYTACRIARDEGADHAGLRADLAQHFEVDRGHPRDRTHRAAAALIRGGREWHAPARTAAGAGDSERSALGGAPWPRSLTFFRQLENRVQSCATSRR
jgi:glutamate-ammonia-ligase adenylyltransferase